MNISGGGYQTELKLKNPGKQLMPLDPNDIEKTEKVADFVTKNNFTYLHDSVLSQKLFGVESSFVEENPDRVHPFSEDFDKNKYIKLYTNNKSGKAGRATWFLADKDVIKKNRSYVKEWQVVVSSANAGGQKRDNQLAIIDNYSAFGRARVALKSFTSEKEAINFKKYVGSYVIRYTFLMTDESLTSLAKWVPDILDYSDENQYLDFEKNIDEQLCYLIGFNDRDFEYIKRKVKTFRGGKN